MTRSGLERAPEFAAVVTLGAGVALTVAPGRVGKAVGFGDRPSVARMVGLMDLALVPGLLRGRPRWPWMVVRALFNVVIAGAYRAEARHSGERSAVAGMYVMLGLTGVDLAVAVVLRSSEHAERLS